MLSFPFLQQASELQTSDEAYTKLFRKAPPPREVQICSLPLDKLVPFFTADIGFHPYTPTQLEAFAEQLKEEGLLVRVIVRPMSREDSYEILAGHNRTSAAKLAGWDVIPSEIVEVDDARAIVIATSTNLIQRLNLACADLMADHDPESQEAFVEMCSIEGYQINKSAMQHIVRQCPPPKADQQALYAAWREARDKSIERMTAPPKKNSFNRKQFAPYLDDLCSDKEVEALFLEFLRERERKV